MRIAQALTPGQRVVIKGSTRQDLPRFFIDMGCKVGAEIGVYKGEYTEKLLQAGLKVYAVDPWKYYDDYAHPQGQKRLDFLYEHTKRVVSKYNCEIIRKTSAEALKDFEDGSLDFVYIDGNHKFKYIAADLVDWSAKVKDGGVVAGHDFVQASSRWSDCQVKYIVLAYVASFHIKNWYLTDRNPNVPGDVNTQSWFWIKGE